MSEMFSGSGAIIAMDMSGMIDSIDKSQYTPFHNIFSLISADPVDSSHIQKIILEGLELVQQQNHYGPKSA